jgi:hypothetical protein
MHTILETDCFILKGTPSAEANKQLDLFTREFGLIRATAQGVRYLKSKLRYSLTDFSYTRISLIRGREYWRVTTASKIGDVSTEVSYREARETLFRIFALLRRLLQGEEAHPELFTLVENVFTLLKDVSLERYAKENLSLEDMFKTPEELFKKDMIEHLSSIEELTVLRILSLLGYVKDDSALRPFAEGDAYDKELLAQARASRKLIVAEINRALAASSL